MADAEEFESNIEVVPDQGSSLDVSVLNAYMKACLETSQKNSRTLADLSRKYDQKRDVRKTPVSPIESVFFNKPGTGKSGKRVLEKTSCNNKKLKTGFVDPGPSTSGSSGKIPAFKATSKSVFGLDATADCLGLPEI